MALPQNTKVAKNSNRKRQNKSDDDHNFHVIVAPGAPNPINVLKFSYFQFSSSSSRGAVLRSSAVRGRPRQGH